MSQTQPTTQPSQEEEDVQEHWAILKTLDNCTNETSLLTDDKEEFVLGRGHQCDIHLAGSEISSKHCRIYRVREAGVDDCVMIEDLSTFGTFVNSKMLGRGKKTLLTHGDSISFSKSPGFIIQITPKASPTSFESAFEKKYSLHATLGSGSFSVVRHGIHKDTGAHCAVKIIDTSRFVFNENVMRALNREVEIMKHVDHPNVVRFMDHVEENGKIYICMELVSGGDLLGFVTARKRLDEEKAKFFMGQMVTVLKYLKANDITHRDLKPDNFLVVTDTEILKLADFGVAKRSGGGKVLSTMCGTPAYLAPEIITSTTSYDSRVDLYSIGAILFFMLSGTLPFKEVSDRDALFLKIRQGAVDWTDECWTTISEPAKDLVRRLMQIRPENRIRLEEIEMHPWISGDASTPLASEMPPMVEGRLYAQLVSSKAIINLDKPMCCIGRAATNSIVISDPRISRRHCTISFENPVKPMLTVHSNVINHIKLNSNHVLADTPVQLRDGDKIQLASAIVNSPNLEYIFKMTIDGAEVSKKRRLSKDGEVQSTDTMHPLKEIPIKKQRLSKFRIEAKGNFAKRENIVEGGSISIGRLPSSSISLDFLFISSNHCEIYAEDNNVFVKDSSSNGTYVNEVRIGKGAAHLLADKDVIRVSHELADDLVEFVVYFN